MPPIFMAYFSAPLPATEFTQMRPFCRLLRQCSLLLLLPFHVVATAVQAAPIEDLTVLWTERRPFQYTDDDGRTKGILVDLGKSVFNKAGIAFNWQEVPANRVLMELKVNEKSLCAVGWYKTEEREAIAQFSLPVYQDKPLRGVFRSSVDVEQGVAGKAVLTNPKVRLLLKQGFAYGKFVDDLIALKNPAEIQRVVGDARNLLRMLRADRADMVMLAQEEIDYYSKLDPDFRKDFKVIVFNEAPEIDRRYIMCSKRVSPQTMKQINAAIEGVVRLK